MPSVCALKRTEAHLLFLVIREPVHFLKLFDIRLHHPHTTVVGILAMASFLYNLLLPSSFYTTVEKPEPIELS